MKTNKQIMKEMYNQYGKRKLVFSTRKGTPYYTWRKFKSLKEGDIVNIDNLEYKIIKNCEWEELSLDSFQDYIDSKLKETKRNKVIETVLMSSPQVIRDTRLNDLLKDE